MKEKEIFEELGLSGNEGKVYSTLVKFGKLSANSISSKSGVPYGRIYDVLNSLIYRGLVEVIPEKTKKYSPSDPENLSKIIEKKKILVQEAENKIAEMKRFYDVENKNPIIISEGNKGFWNLIREMSRPSVSSYAVKWSSEINPTTFERVRKSVKKGVDVKTLSNYHEENKKDVKKWLKVNKNIRKFNNEGVAISIVDDKEVMIGLIKSNVSLLIKDEPFAKVLKKMFLQTYENAEKIK